MSPDPTEPPHLRNGRKWDWPSWLIAYIITLIVVRDIILTLLQ